MSDKHSQWSDSGPIKSKRRKRDCLVYNWPDGFAWRRCGDDDNDDGKGEKDYFRRRNWRLCIMPRPLSSWSIGPPQLHLTSVPPFIDEGTFMKDTRVLFLLLLLFDHVCLSMEIQAQDSFGHTWYLSFFYTSDLRPRNFTLESLLICDKICPATKLCTKFYTLCHILHCIAIFSCSNWKILHLAKYLYTTSGCYGCDKCEMRPTFAIT